MFNGKGNPGADRPAVNVMQRTPPEGPQGGQSVRATGKLTIPTSRHPDVLDSPPTPVRNGWRQPVVAPQDIERNRPGGDGGFNVAATPGLDFLLVGAEPPLPGNWFCVFEEAVVIEAEDLGFDADS